MKRVIPLALSLVLMMFLTSAPVFAACNVCHSKNPKMVKMHEALQFKDCFKCHGSGQVKKASEERAAQMKSDPLCAGCHRQ